MGLRLAPITHPSPGWRFDLRLAPPVAPSSARPKSYPPTLIGAMPSSSTGPHNPRLAPQLAFSGSASDRTPGLHRTRYLPATPLNPNPGLRQNPYPPVRPMRSLRLSPVARILSLRWRPASGFRRKPDLPVSPTDLPPACAECRLLRLPWLTNLDSHGILILRHVRGVTSDLRRMLCLPVRPVPLGPTCVGLRIPGQACDEFSILAGPCIVG